MLCLEKYNNYHYERNTWVKEGVMGYKWLVYWCAHTKDRRNKQKLQLMVT